MTEMDLCIEKVLFDENKISELVKKVGKQISEDYVAFRSTDINGLSDEVELATRRLNREGSNIEHDEI